MTMTGSDPFDDPRNLQARILRVLTALQLHAGSECRRCGTTVCGHVILFNIVLGDEAKALCLDCLAAQEGREAVDLRDSLTIYVRSKPCLGQGWRYAAIKELMPPDAPPTCLFGAEERPTPKPRVEERLSRASDALVPDERWDAGDMACGDLLLQLKIRMQALTPGLLFELRALDPGAVNDIPAWCRITGHALLSEEHPIYRIRRKDDR